MARFFNINGTCYPDKHYMVNLDSRLAEVRKLIDRGDYFVINRARQYGKTTMLRALAHYLQDQYIVLSLSFQRMSSASFRDECAFSSAFAAALLRVIRNRRKKIAGLSPQSIRLLETAAENTDLIRLFDCLSELCASAERPVVLMIDEVDSASNNQVFLDFLAQLRALYLDREETPAFQSVILAGVYDIKNLKQKIRPEEDHRYNSPWNIAAKFSVDMSFSIGDISGMLEEYAADRQLPMNVEQIAILIHDYTSGYPFLVSCICKLMDEQIPGMDGFADPQSVWTKAGVTEAVRLLLKESNTLFDDMRKKISDYPELRAMLYAILFDGKSFPYNPDNYSIDIGTMFGFICEDHGMTAVANRIFETRLYNLFMSEELINSATYQAALLDRNHFVKDGCLDMDRVMERFVKHFTDIYGGSSASFVEENGRRLFLLYLKPIINGGGNYYIEARTRDLRRTDVIVDYHGHQYIIEMKIWHGDEYNRRGERQLAEYLESYGLKKGYLLSFNFNKNKRVGISTVVVDGKCILEAVV